MILGRVVGTVVATHKDRSLSSWKLLVVQPLETATLVEYGQSVVAVDVVGAGYGEVVLVASGSAARQAHDIGNAVPTDHTITAIVDSVEIGGRTEYVKA